jgi:hypothetical protein
LNGLDNAVIASAAAEVSLQSLDDVPFRGLRILPQESVGLEDHPRRAESALERVMPHERFLQRVEFSVFLKAFDGDDLFSFRILDGILTGQDRFIIDEDGTGSAESLSAAVFCAGVFKVGAQNP